MEAEARRFLHSVREKLPGVQTFLLLGPGGELLTHATEDPRLEVDVFAAEYATLLRIAQHTSVDTGLGDIGEQILISASSTILLLRVPPDRFGVFVCSSEEQLGRLRYELKRSLLYSSLSHL